MMATESDVMYYGQPKADDDLFYAGEEIGYCTRRKLKELFFGFEPDQLYEMRLVAGGPDKYFSAVLHIWDTEMTESEHRAWMVRTLCD